MKAGLRRGLIAAAVICVTGGALGAGLAEADGTTDATSNSTTTAFTSSTPFPSASSAIFPVATGPITVVLPALKSNATQGAAAPDVPIDCSINLTDYVHYSKPGNDVSWYWSWACDGLVHLTGSQALYDEGYPIRTSGVNSSGISNSENIRYDGCVGATWFGQASGTFTAAGHGPASFAGDSPDNLINCP